MASDWMMEIRPSTERWKCYSSLCPEWFRERVFPSGKGLRRMDITNTELPATCILPLFVIVISICWRRPGLYLNMHKYLRVIRDVRRMITSYGFQTMEEEAAYGWLRITIYSTGEARVRSQVRSCEICGGESGTRTGFLRVLRSFPPILIPPTAL
jgi:hypothetical protein